MLVHLVELGLDFIPVVGPALSIAFGVTASLIQNPDAWKTDDILGLGLLDAGAAIMGACFDSGKKAQKYTIPGFIESGESEAAPLTGGEPDQAPAATTQRGIFAPRKESTEESRNKLLREKALRAGLDPAAPLEKRAQDSAEKKHVVQAALGSLKETLRELSGSKGT